MWRDGEPLQSAEAPRAARRKSALAALILVVGGVTCARRDDGAGPAAPARLVAAQGPRDAAAVGACAAPSHTIVVAPSELNRLRSAFRAVRKREPSGLELADLVQGYLGEEIVFREGIGRRLDRDDEVVRRRVVEKTLSLLRSDAGRTPPSRAELRQWFDTYPHRFRVQAAVTFEQLFFDPRLHGDATAAARQALEAGVATPAGGPEPGDRSLLPRLQESKIALELAHMFGPDFADAVMRLPVGQHWQGPIPSQYGAHLVKILARTAERLPTFDEVEPQVRADWLTVEMRGVRAAAESLAPAYEVILPAETEAQLAGTPALAPFSPRFARP